MSTFSPLCDALVDFGLNKSNSRTEIVTKITIHHMAGVSSGEACARAHRSGSRDASANYYIGNSGDICGGVSEDRRAWTSSSAWNDQRAITIEVSNSKASAPWPVSDAAYQSLIRLCVDICRRYNITPHYSGSKDDSLTVHRMYAATACPGDTIMEWLKSGRIERDILAGLGMAAEPVIDKPTDPREAYIWRYLFDKIGNAYGVAGLMGNLYAESGLRPDNLQNSYEKRLGMTDQEYTAKVNSGEYSKKQFISDKAGYGLAQWTYWSRKEDLYNFRGERSIDCLEMQLDFLLEELNSAYTHVYRALKAAGSVYEASTAVLTQYERPADQSEHMRLKRAAYGQMYYDRYAGDAGSHKAGYLVRVTAGVLNVRKGPGTSFEVTTTVHKGEVYTIVQIVGEWGQLKSGAGWINLKYTEKV